jgi:hypothetical protein
MFGERTGNFGRISLSSGYARSADSGAGRDVAFVAHFPHQLEGIDA